MKLYDMTCQEWRGGHFKRGDTWRSTHVYECHTCHTKTNRWIMGGWPGMGPRILCPAGIYHEHEELYRTIQKHHALDEELQEYLSIVTQGENASHQTDKLFEHEETKKSLLERKINSLRARFTNRFDDIQGTQEPYHILPLYSSSRYLTSKPLD